MNKYNICQSRILLINVTYMFDNIKILKSSYGDRIQFTHNGKIHRRKIWKGRYGNYFDYGKPYYIKEVKDNE